MNNLKAMYKCMRVAAVDTNIFAVNYNGRSFACILIIQDYGCTLFISTLGARPETIAVNIPTDFSVPTRLDTAEYLILARYLGFSGKSGNKFIPSKFFKEFDARIFPKLGRPATTQEKTRAIGRTSTVAEEDKIYFCGWRRNGNAGHVTPKNYEKTKMIMGKKIANELRAANISSRWTSIEEEENLAALNNYLNTLN